MRRMCEIGPLLAVVLGMLLIPRGAAAQPSPEEGGRLFVTYCASCHGRNASGDGPMAASLRVVPPNLTQLARRNGGMFPAERVRRIIDGRDVSSHGTRDMPVWGDAFTKRDGLSEADARKRIDALVRYLDALQERPGQ